MGVNGGGGQVKGFLDEIVQVAAVSAVLDVLSSGSRANEHYSADPSASTNPNLFSDSHSSQLTT